MMELTTVKGSQCPLAQKWKVSKTCVGPSSDEIVTILQKMLNDLYSDEVDTADKARQILYGTQTQVYGFMKNLVTQMTEDDALAMLAEIDHRLTFPDTDFKFEYDVPNCGSNYRPYTMTLRYGDPMLGFVKMSVNAMSQ